MCIFFCTWLSECLMSVVYRLLSAVCHPLSAVYFLSSAHCFMLSVQCCLSSIVWHLSFVVKHRSSVVRFAASPCSLSVVSCRWSAVSFCLLVREIVRRCGFFKQHEREVVQTILTPDKACSFISSFIWASFQWIGVTGQAITNNLHLV